MAALAFISAGEAAWVLGYLCGLVVLTGALVFLIGLVGEWIFRRLVDRLGRRGDAAPGDRGDNQRPESPPPGV